MKLHPDGVRQSRRTLALFVCLCLAWTSLSFAAGGTLKIIPHADLKNTDPIWTTAYITRNHGYMIYDTLFSLDENLKPQPQMVDTWSVSEDGLTYAFKLRPDLKWHDGTPVRAADCVASIKRWGKRDGMGQKLMEFTESLNVVDDDSFTLTLKEPYGLVLESLGKLSSNVPFMMPERLAGSVDAFTQITEHIGSGPFKFVKDEWVPGSKVVYERNADYVPRDEPPSFASGGKQVHVDRVEWIYIPDPATAQAALMAGEVDYYERPPTDLLPLMERNPAIKIAIIDPLGTQGMLRPNHLHPPFNNKKARQALLWMVKQEDYLRAIVGDPKFWSTCSAYFMCGTPLETDAGSEALVNQDFEKAKALMEEAGYKGEPIILMDPTDIPVLHGASLVTAQMLRKIGVNVQVQAMDWSTLTSRRAEKKSPSEGGWHLFHTYGTGADMSSPVNNIGVSGGCEEKAWFGWPCDDRLEKLRDDWARATDAGKQKEIATELQKVAFDNVPYVNYGQWFLPTAYRDNLKGVIVSPVPFFWNIVKE
ncbi:ABC transporter substrate-binding protein [Candidatus Entotheonella palauensis]|uniref:ABC transporter substrate-binding protein n=1 Tax=Candidatus Entotheonella palauensis TaxID=93172 RepID=UPI000B7FC105|nr:ABC transporter substrate-binding protein [Candidatus Entotheonella palauensis]